MFNFFRKGRSISNVKEQIKEIEADGIVTREEFEKLNEVMMEDGVVTDEEYMLLRHTIDKIQRGELKEVNQIFYDNIRN